MSPCDLKILIVNLFQEDGGNLKCLSCGTIFCRTGLDILVCNPGDHCSMASFDVHFPADILASCI